MKWAKIIASSFRRHEQKNVYFLWQDKGYFSYVIYYFNGMFQSGYNYVSGKLLKFIMREMYSTYYFAYSFWHINEFFEIKYT